MKKRIISLLLAMITVINIVPWSILPTLSESTGIDISEMEVGVLYTAEWDYSEYTNVFLYVFQEDGMVEYKDPVEKNTLPQSLTVILMEEGDTFLYIANEDWPTEYDEYRYVFDYELIVIGKYEEAHPDDGLIRGQVGLVMDGETVTTLNIEAGDKTYVFTELGSQIDGTPSYRWQMLIDRENNRWADIRDYYYPYAIVSEALVANASLDGGSATLRCIARYNEKDYVSGELDIDVIESQPAQADNAIAPNMAGKADGLSIPPSLLSQNDNVARADVRASDAFQIAVQYVWWNNSHLAEDSHGQQAADSFTVTLIPGIAYDGVKNHPNKPGYKAYIRNDEATSNYREYTARENPTDPNSEETHKYVEAQPIVFEHQQDDLEITIYYLPIEVTFIVNHHFQNLEDDNYYVHHSDFLKGLSDYPVSDSSVHYEDAPNTLLEDLYLPLSESVGFSGLYYDKEMRISASGNTVVDIYYDRNYYLIDFDLTASDGSEGFGIMPLYVRYDTRLMLPEPENPGYAFDSWTLTNVYNSEETTGDDGTIVVVKTPVDDEDIWNLYRNTTNMLTVHHNLTYKANWTVATAAYTVIYWRENADSTDASNKSNYSVWATETITGIMSGITVDCSDIEIPDDLAQATIDGTRTNEKPYFTRADAMSDQYVVVKGDNSAVVNIYYTRNTYHIWFTNINGACALYEHEHGDGNCNNLMLCTLEEHTHTDVCGTPSIGCGLDEHAQHNSTCCKISKDGHVHTPACYANTSTVSTNINNAPQNPVDGQIYRYWYNNYIYHIYINGSWYGYSGWNVSNGQIIEPTGTSCPVVHLNSNHATGACMCPTSLHTHTTDCYKYSSCDKNAHTHNSACYSECSLYEHTHATNCSTANTARYTWAISAKYGADISKVWPTADRVAEKYPNANKLYGWTNISSSTLVTKRVNMTADLCDTSDNMHTGRASTTNSNTAYYVYYLFESFDQNSAASGNDRRQYNGTYYDSDSRYYQIVYGLSGNLSPKQITGMEAAITQSQTSGNNRLLYYDRNRHEIIFENVGVQMYTMSDIMFEQPLNKAFFDAKMADYTGTKEAWDFVDADGNTVQIYIPIPDTPDTYEDGSVVFAGWYTTPMCVDGTEYNFAINTMPDAEITLFAKWEPTYWDVEVYQENPTENPDAQKLKDFLQQPFGTILSSAQEPQRTPPEKDYIFAGWYYIEGEGENAVEKRFDFNTMPIKHNYVIYAEWTTQVPVPFEVHYITMVDGEAKEIAEPTKGVSLAEQTKSFTAKVDKDLFEGYQTGYFPEMREQTVKMQPGENIIVFEYLTGVSIRYRIHHVFVAENLKNTVIGSDTLSLEWIEDVQVTDSALLTVEFRAEITQEKIREKLLEKNPAYTEAQTDAVWNVIKNLSPDAYTQRLILEAHSNLEDNEIVFNWSGRYNMVVYEVHHLYETLDSTDSEKKYETKNIQSYDVQYDENNPGNGSYKESLIKGYQFEKVETNNADKSFTLRLPTAENDGLIIKVYYERETYQYTLTYFDDKSYEQLQDSKTQTGKYGDVIKIGDHAESIGGFDLANGDDEVSLEFNNQEIICYYTRRSATLKYEQIGDGGSLIRWQENILYGETPKGSYPVLVPGYVLEKWQYKNENGELVDVPSELATVVGDTISPRTVTENDVGKTYEFYATIVPTSLTITNTIETNNAPVWVTEGQGFIYNIVGVENTDTAGVSLRVAVPVGETRTILALPCGEYTITVESEWSWRYADESQGDTSKEITLDDVFDVEFVYSVPENGDKENGGYYITDNNHN